MPVIQKGPCAPVNDKRGRSGTGAYSHRVNGARGQKIECESTDFDIGYAVQQDRGRKVLKVLTAKAVCLSMHRAAERMSRNRPASLFC